jgi:hypothetical protein
MDLAFGVDLSKFRELGRHVADSVFEKNVVGLALAQDNWFFRGIGIAIYQELPVRQLLCGKMVGLIVLIGDFLVVQIDAVDETEAPVKLVEFSVSLFKDRLALFSSRTEQLELSRSEEVVHHCPNAMAGLSCFPQDCRYLPLTLHDVAIDCTDHGILTAVRFMRDKSPQAQFEAREPPDTR